MRSTLACVLLLLLNCRQPSQPVTETHAPDDDPVAVIRNYYAAINDHDYRKAFALWGANGPPGQTFEQFEHGFADTESVRVQTGTPSRIEGAAGSHYIEVPVTIDAKTKSGETQQFEGTYTLRRSAVSGAAKGWFLYRAEIHSRSAR